MIKADDEMRLVFGWANVTALDGAEVVDLEKHSMSSETLLKAFTEFMMDVRKGGILHLKNEQGEPIEVGQIVYAFPFTSEIKKAFGIDIPQEGVVIGYYVANDFVLEKVKDGTLQAFSIAGPALLEEVEEEEDEEEDDKEAA